MRDDIEISAEGATLRGWLYLPEGNSRPVPAVVMAHGFSAVKEMYLDAFAEVFASAGLAAIVFDNRNFGASDGEPRQEIDPWRQVADYRDVITYARLRPEIDADRIGVWGSSYSGGHAITVGALDRRVRCVVSQVPLISGYQTVRRLVRPDFLQATLQVLDADREARFRGEPPAVIPVVDADPLAQSALPTPDSWEWFSRTGKDRAPSWRNEVTVRSMDLVQGYEPGSYIDRVSPTPLLMIIATNDVLVTADLAFAAYGRALEPKRVEILRGGHFDAYTAGPHFTQASEAARDWFVQHLVS
jgi:fermentation-respiration switch protein FrsA (DUF1100 family)